MPVWYWIFTSVRTVKLQIYGLDKYLAKKNMEVKLAMCIRVINIKRGGY